MPHSCSPIVLSPHSFLLLVPCFEQFLAGDSVQVDIGRVRVQLIPTGGVHVEPEDESNAAWGDGCEMIVN